MNKENYVWILVLILLIGFLFVGYQGIVTEKKLNECAIKFNNCTKNCGVFAPNRVGILSELPVPEGYKLPQYNIST